MSQKPFFVTIPHSGETIPPQTPWLKGLPEEVLMRDIDRFVDRLYLPILDELKITTITTDWHRYAVDLNRLPQDIDQKSVMGAEKSSGFERGFHWSVTTLGEPLITQPMSHNTHLELKNLIFDPFHARIKEEYKTQRNKTGRQTIYHLDLHSMPSVGTAMHLDPGERRADIVISDSHGKSCHAKFRDLVIAAYVTSGFKVGYNWPYKGGRLTEEYGKPAEGQQVLQVELNRSLYMNEVTKKLIPNSEVVINKLKNAIRYIESHVINL